MPQSLARKRIWNKKYPVCIKLDKQDDFISKAEGDRSETHDNTGTKERGEGGGGVQERGSSSASSKDLTLYLFGRTGREKEEWFQRFLLASRLKADLKKSSSVVGNKTGEIYFWYLFQKFGKKYTRNDSILLCLLSTSTSTAA